METAAEALLTSLGVCDPGDIDIEAIAWCEGARVRYRPLDGCEARISGYDNRAIITVDISKSWRRQRFSIAHELGHWKYHRRRVLVCRSEEIGGSRQGRPATEKVADRYAADLLLPWFLFQPAIQKHARLSFGVLRELSDQFETSLTATAIRSIRSRHTPSFLISHGPHGRKWFVRGQDVPERWFPRSGLDPDSFAFDLLYGADFEQPKPRLIDASAWFDRNEANHYELYEHSLRVSEDEVLTILLLTDEIMLEEH